MKRIVLLLILTIVVCTLFAVQERGLTTNEIDPGEKIISGKATPFEPTTAGRTSAEKLPDIDRDEWTTVDSINFDSFIAGYSFLGVEFNNLTNSMTMISNMGELIPLSVLAVKKAPVWIRSELEHVLRQLTTVNQEKWAQLILDTNDPFVDEIAFSIAASSPAYLSLPYIPTQLFTENAELIYTHDAELSYVQIINYGNSSDDDYYSTTRYWKENQDGEAYQVEVPRDIYYWYLVHPKLTDEIPAYINPNTLESSSHLNNITQPPVGQFWRNFLYNFNDEGYPKLRYYLLNCDLAANGTISLNNAIGAISIWLGQTLQFTSNAERPHQPVRIYKKHIGRCGEHADMRVAAARAALIPCTSILSISGDHTWNEYWDEGWVHWDSPDINNPLVYEHGWGKVFGSVFEIRSDGLLNSVTDTYSDGYSDLTIYVFDNQGNPVDGARVLLGVDNSGTVVVDNAGFTDVEGKYTFVVGDTRTYYAKISSSIGATDYIEVVQNTQPDEEYTYSINLTGTVPLTAITEIDPPVDTTDDYRIIYDFDVINQVTMGAVVFDDLLNSVFYNTYREGAVNFFMTDLINYAVYQGQSPFSAFNVTENCIGATGAFAVPASEYWYLLVDNAFRLRNPQHVQGYFVLQNYDNVGGTGTLQGIVLDVVSNQPVSGALIQAGMYQTTTDASGNYSMSVYPGSYTVVCSADDYQYSFDEDIYLAAGGLTITSFLLREIAGEVINVAATEEGSDLNIVWSEQVNQIREQERDFTPAERFLESFSLYYLPIGEEFHPSNWQNIAHEVTGTEYIYSNWTNVEAGVYKIAVTAVYSDSCVSSPVFSNIIYHNAFAAVGIDVITNSGDVPYQAEVFLENLDAPNSIYKYRRYADEDGSATILQAFKGIYRLTVTHPLYETSVIDSISITEDTDLLALLIEKLVSPMDLMVVDYTAFWGEMPLDRNLQGFNIYMDGNLVASQISTFSFDLSGTSAALHTFGISASYTTGTGPVNTIQFVNGNSLEVENIAYYPLDGNANNVLSANYQGTIMGDTQFLTSPISGMYADFDGDGDYIDCTDIDLLDGTDEFSVMFWVNINSWEAWNSLFNKAGKFSIETGGSQGELYAIQRNPDNNYGYKANAIRMNGFNHVVYSFNGNAAENSGKLRLFINGEEMEMSYSGNIPPTTFVSDDPFTITGNSHDAADLDGQIDEFRIWTKPLSRLETQHLYLQEAPFWGTLQGHVYDENNNPLLNAEIKAGMFNIMTDEQGYYVLEIPAIIYDVTCHLIGYDDLTENIELTDGESATLDFYMSVTGADNNSSESFVFSCYNYPNPFNPKTTISFTISGDENVALDIFNIKGQLVKSFGKQMYQTGSHSLVWDGKNNSGSYVGSGIYFYKIKAGNLEKTGKMLMLK